jgi:hypothetical protein
MFNTFFPFPGHQYIDNPICLLDIPNRIPVTKSSFVSFQIKPLSLTVQMFTTHVYLDSMSPQSSSSSSTLSPTQNLNLMRIVSILLISY